jgi:hypothetical protein
MVASAGENDRDLTWTQLAKKFGAYDIIEF